MDASVKKIMTDLRAGKFAPVYFLQGEETFYIDLIADFIEANALTDAEKGFNQVVVYGKDVAMATILTHARRFPMMAQRQVVIVKEAQDIQDLGSDDYAHILGLRPISYHSKAPADDPEREFIGLIAEEVAEIDPRLVHYYDGRPDGVMYDRITVGLLGIVQEQQEQIDALRAEIEALKVH